MKDVLGALNGIHLIMVEGLLKKTKGKPTPDYTWGKLRSPKRMGGKHWDFDFFAGKILQGTRTMPAYHTEGPHIIRFLQAGMAVYTARVVGNLVWSEANFPGKDEVFTFHPDMAYCLHNQTGQPLHIAFCCPVQHVYPNTEQNPLGDLLFLESSPKVLETTNK